MNEFDLLVRIRYDAKNLVNQTDRNVNVVNFLNRLDAKISAYLDSLPLDKYPDKQHKIWENYVPITCVQQIKIPELPAPQVRRFTF